MIKVLIVDDSALMRKILSDILNEDEELQVIAVANNGKDALEKIVLFKPDVVTLDMEMPVMDGIETLKNIVAKYNIPVLMISSLTTEGAEYTIRALEEGAVDFIPKPKNIFGLGGSAERKKIIDKVKIASRSNRRRLYKKIDISEPVKKKFDFDILSGSSYNNIVAIGTSTGGPRALQEIIPKIPYNINATIVIVQHMPPNFTKSLADRLNSLSQILVKEGEEGEKLKRGYCYIAPGDYHLLVGKRGDDLFIKLNQSPPILGLRPAVDPMMESVANIEHKKKVGIILTGMGSDGTLGLKKVKEKKGFIIAQDEKSSVVFGMPRAAINIGIVDKILPLESIADEIINQVGVL